MAFDVFISFPHGGGQRVYASHAAGESDMDRLGANLWRGSPGARLQAEIATLFDGCLPIMDARGRFHDWRFSARMSIERAFDFANLRGHRAFADVDDAGIRRWADSLRAGRIEPDLLARRRAIPLDERFHQRNLLHGQRGELLSAAKPLERHLLGGATGRAPVLLDGERACRLLSWAVGDVPDGHLPYFDGMMRLGASHFHANGRWHASIRCENATPVGKAGIHWVPTILALAVSSGFKLGDVWEGTPIEFAELALAATPQDILDLRRLAASLPPKFFFHGHPEAAAWIQSFEIAEISRSEASAKTAEPKRI